MADTPTMQITPEEARVKYARLIRERATIRDMYREKGKEIEELTPLLLNGGDGMRVTKAEGTPTKYGVLTRHVETKGRRYVITDEVDKDAGELPEELRPVPDERLVVEHMSELPTAIQAELKMMSEAEEPVVKITDKTKYPTVAKLTEAFGKDTKYVGNPPAEHSIVLVIDDEVILGIDGIVGQV